MAGTGSAGTPEAGRQLRRAFRNFRLVIVVLILSIAIGRKLCGRPCRQTLAYERWGYHGVLRDEFGLNMSDREIDQCIAIMKAKGSGDAPHPFFA
jgi:hypothetical protein